MMLPGSPFAVLCSNGGACVPYMTYRALLTSTVPCKDASAASSQPTLDELSFPAWVPRPWLCSSSFALSAVLRHWCRSIAPDSPGTDASLPVVSLAVGVRQSASGAVAAARISYHTSSNRPSRLPTGVLLRHTPNRRTGSQNCFPPQEICAAVRCL